MTSVTKNSSFLASLILVIAAISATATASAMQKQQAVLPPGISKELTTLDSLLQHLNEFVEHKETRLDKLRTDFMKTGDTNHRYWLANDLYDEYCAYDSDSAMHYIDMASDLATCMGRKDLVQEMQLNRAYILSATGMLTEAENTLANINPDSLPADLALKYCDRMLFLSTHRDQYLGVKYDTEMYSAQIDSLLKVAKNHIKPQHPQYIWLLGWSSLSSKEEARKAIPEVEKRVTSSHYNTRADAMDAYVLAKLHERIGDRDNYLKYLILSAQADIRSSTKEIGSLEEVTQLLFNLGDYEHANTYLNYCITWANEYKSRVRIGRLAEIQRNTLGAIHKRIQRQTVINRIYITVLVAMLLVLLFAVMQIWRQNKKLKASRIGISEANMQLSAKVDELQNIRSQLHAANEQLHATNSKLQEAYSTAKQTAHELAGINESKEQYIANIFTICSNYISSHEEFRANLHKLLANRKFEQALQLVKSPELSYEEIKELYANFDKIFLQIYPDFVNDFNTLLREEDRISLKNPDKLTTELRIYALVRLGLNDSVKIARFLHCSVQTVYNTRQRTRNKAAVPKEEFALKVRSLGKPTL